MSGNDRPLPPRLDPRLGRESARGSSAHSPGARRAVRAAVVARSIAGVLSVLLLAGCGWGWYLARVAQASVSRTDAIPGSGNSDVNGKHHAGKEMNLLLVGMDSRKGLTPEQQQEFNTGDPAGLLNTDSMMLVHVPADGSGTSFVSLPRDTYVPIPGYGKAKLNSAYARGYNAVQGTEAERDAAGAQLLIQTISQFSGLQIDHFAEINLLGFINLSNIVGGVTVNICAPTTDSATGAHFDSGVQTLSGKDALLFVRERHGLRRGDLDRVVRQQVYIAGMLRNVLSSHLLLNLGKQKAFVEQVGSSVTLDRGLDVFDLAARLQGVQLGNITFQTIPGLTDAKVGTSDILQPPADEVLKAFFASLTATPAAGSSATAPTSKPPEVSPGSVTVSVLNGSGVSGAASAAAAALTGAGFKASSGGNATRTDTTTVRHHAGDDAAAALVAAQVPSAAVAVDNSVPAGTVQLVIGHDYNGIGRAVTTQPPAATAGSYASVERTAADSTCIN
ncbi:MAG: Cell envelope-related transcriptional attenuator [Blastococcus sp.]|nr:Cell envelope-related transcriptional attenuator [Blastococcus sp.]